MTEKTEKSEKESGKKIVVINKGSKAYETSQGWLHPQESQELPADEAKKLMDYHDIIDAAKYLPKSSRQDELEAENKTLREENHELKQQLKQHEEKKEKKK